jgi:preprotein translocase subunit SecA
MQAHHFDPDTGEDDFAPIYQASEVVVAPESRNPDDPSTWGKVGRNEVCPCGSGKKYKHCHGAFEQV